MSIRLIDGRTVRLQFYTGSDITVIGKDEWYRLGSPNLVAGEAVAHVSGGRLSLIGRSRGRIRTVGREGEVYIDVANRDGLNLFGLNTLDLWPALRSETREPECILELQRASSANSGNFVRGSLLRTGDRFHLAGRVCAWTIGGFHNLPMPI